MKTLSYWMQSAMRGGAVLCATVLAVPSLGSACSPPGPSNAVRADNPQDQQATFDRDAEAVLNAVTSVLVERDEMTDSVASDWVAQYSEALRQRETVRVTSESVNVSAARLRDLIRDDQARFVSDSGGRYYVTISITPDSRTRTTVEVVATVIGTTPGPGPLGGRPLASNGSLERAILNALRASIG